VNRKELFSDQYKKYLSDQLRRAFGYEGCPIILIPRARPQDEKPEKKTANRSKQRFKRR
jgi:predicted GTPase